MPDDTHPSPFKEARAAARRERFRAVQGAYRTGLLHGVAAGAFLGTLATLAIWGR